MVTLIIEKNYVNEQESDAYFTTYLLDDSKELLPGKKRPVVIICPGGGYLFTSDREAEPIAMKFLSLGYHAVVLRYTVGDKEGKKTGIGKIALKELAQTIRYLKQNSESYFIDPDKIAVCGFSAGAHLAAGLGVHWCDKDFLKSLCLEPDDAKEIKPNALILGYGLLDYQVMVSKMKSEMENHESKDTFGFREMANLALTGVNELTEDLIKEYSPSYWVSENTPPSFLWHTSKDDFVYSENSLTFAMALARHKIPYELHVFQDGGHGLALANEVTANTKEQIEKNCVIWFDLAAKWLKKHIPLS